MNEQAIAGFQKAITRGGSTELSFLKSGLGHVYGVSGKKAEAQAVLDELKQLSRQEYVPADSIALVYAGLGEKDQAFAWLEKAYQEHSFGMAWIKEEPRWDSLRSDPRFADLVRRVWLQE
jgi:tetratricopeptide (TPR) repeat protein